MFLTNKNEVTTPNKQAAIGSLITQVNIKTLETQVDLHSLQVDDMVEKVHHSDIESLLGQI